MKRNKSFINKKNLFERFKKALKAFFLKIGDLADQMKRKMPGRLIIVAVLKTIQDKWFFLFIMLFPPIITNRIDIISLSLEHRCLRHQIFYYDVIKIFIINRRD